VLLSLASPCSLGPASVIATLQFQKGRAVLRIDAQSINGLAAHASVLSV